MRAGLAAEAAVAVVIADVAVHLLPSGRTSRLLGNLESPPRDVPDPDAELQARRIGRAVEGVAGRLPWHPVCLPQAIATRWLLKRRGIPCSSHLGVTGRAPLAAHAWVTVGDHVVQGGHVTDATEVARFG